VAFVRTWTITPNVGASKVHDVVVTLVWLALLMTVTVCVKVEVVRVTICGTSKIPPSVPIRTMIITRRAMVVVAIALR
jgi:hypothetical protein